MNKLSKNILRKSLVILLLVAMLLSAASINLPAAQGTPSLEDLSLSSSGEKVDVLVGFHGISGRELVKSHGGTIYMEFEMIDAVAATMSPGAALQLSRHPFISYVEPDERVYSLSPTEAITEMQVGGLSDARQVVPWGIDRLFGDESYPFDTWEKSTGAGIGVAILDTGIYRDHEDIEAAGGINFSESPGDRFDYEYYDDNGHGTHVAGIIGALDNEVGVVGISFEADLFAVKILDENGLGTISSVIDGIEWAVNENIPIINMSLYSNSYSRTLDQVCDTAYKEGYLLVAAAGNLGNENGSGENVSYPAAYDSVIAVAASDEADQRASFSSTGPEVELIAPGEDIWSTWTANSYNMYNGTSMASLHVAGAAALAWAAGPELSNVQVRKLLQQTAENLWFSKNQQGYGLVRADQAVAAVVPAEPGDDIERGAREVIMEIGSKTAYFDGEPHEMDAVPFIRNSRTFVPVRFLGEAFAAAVDWEPKDSRVETVYLKRKDIEVTIKIGSHHIYVVEEGTPRTVVSDVASFIQNGRTFLPFRAIAEAFGAGVGYDSDRETGLVNRVWFSQ